MSLSEPLLIVPDFIPEQREEGLEMGPNSSQGCENPRTDQSHFRAMKESRQLSFRTLAPAIPSINSKSPKPLETIEHLISSQ